MTNDITTPPAPHKRPRRIGTVLSFVVALAVLTYVGNWFAAAFWLEGKIEDWAEQERARGNEVAYSALRFEGFPFEMTVLASDVNYRRTHGNLTESLTSERLRFAAKPWAPLDVTIVSETKLVARQDARHGTRVTLSAAAGSRLDTHFYGSGKLESARLSLPAGTLTSERLGSRQGVREAARFGSTTVTLDQAEKVKNHAEAAAVLSLVANRFESPILTQFGAGSEHATLAFEATLRGELEGTGAEELALWRDSGGVLDIDRMAISKDQMNLKMTATLALDRLLRPEGAGTVEIKGTEQLIEELVATGQLKRDAAEIAKLVLAAFTKTDKADGARVVHLPIAAQDGKVSAGPFTLFRLPTL